MKIIQPTLKRFLEEANRIYLRLGRKDGTAAIIIGGFRSDGAWTEFHSQPNANSSQDVIICHLKLLALIMKNEKKRREFQMEGASPKDEDKNSFQVSQVNFRSDDSLFGWIDLGLN